MRKNKSKADESTALRAEAQTRLAKRVGKIRERAGGDPEQNFHELQVHQIELEMQNEELHRTQQVLEESRSRYSDLYDFAPVGYFTTNKKGVIIEANLTGCQMLGIERVHLIGKPFGVFVGRQSLDQFVLHRKSVVRGTARQSCDICLVRKNGEKFDARLESVAAADDNGDLTLCRTAIIDVTERKQAEETLQQNEEWLRQANQELQRSNADLEQFAYVASHDLREPLRAITGFLDLLRRRCKDTLDEKANEYIDYAADGAKRMDELLTGLLEYARIQTQGGPQAAVSAQAALNTAMDNLRESITECSATISSDPLPVVNVDAPQFTQLLQNLIHNALKFRAGQRPEIHVGCVRQDSAWLFSVRDNGIGIDPRFHERIFTIFHQINPQDKAAGFGVGLSICKKIVERHNGTIWVESEPGHGAAFCFTIPQ